MLAEYTNRRIWVGGVLTSHPPIIMLVAKGYQIPELPRARLEAETLLKAGYRVSVVAWDRYAEFPALAYINGVIVRSIRFANLTNFSKAGLMLGGMMFQILAFLETLRLIRSLKQRPIVHAHDINTLLIACLLRRIGLCSALVYDCRELTYGVYLEWFNVLVASIVRVIEEGLVTYADAVITPSDDIAKYLRKFNQETDVIYNCPRLTDIPKVSKKEAREALGLPLDSFIVSFVGGIRYGCMLDLLLEVSKLTGSKRIHYVVVGEGPLASEFRRAAREAIVSSVTVVPRVPHNTAMLYVLSSDLTWSVYQHGPNAMNERVALGWKLFESLACGVPVIVNAGTRSSRLVMRYNCGVVFEGDDPNDMLRLILGLATNAKQHHALSIEAQRVSKKMNFNWEKMEERLLAIYRRIQEPPCPETRHD